MAAYKNCEISKKFIDLPSSSDSSSDDSDNDEILSGSTRSASQYSSSGKTSEKRTKSVQRMPTRKPDPNVSNRNALLARENRRKKKEYVETLEKELSSIKYANKKLHKTLRKHMKLVKKLEHEKQYYKGLVSNKSELLNLISALNGQVPPIGAYSPKQSSCSPTDSNRSLSSLEQPLTYDCDDNGSAFLLEDSVLTESFINDFNFFTDSNYEHFSDNNWDQLLGMDADVALPDEVCGYFPTNQQSVVSGEHNYSNSRRSESSICMHLAEGTVSSENCHCSHHLNVKRSCPLPNELLVVD